MTTSAFPKEINTSLLTVAESYYKAMVSKDFATMATYLHPQVVLLGPLGKLNGQEAVAMAAKNFGNLLQDIHIHHRFSSKEEIMLVYDMVVAEPIGTFKAAVRMEFKENLISTIDLFYDATPFQEKKKDIFDTK